MSSTSFLILLFAIPAQHTTEKPAKAENVESARASEWLKLAKQQAAEYQIHVGTDRDHKLILRAEPILRWTNPRYGQVHACAFIWTSRGRPEVLAKFITRYKPHRFATHGFQSLCLNTLTAQRADRRVWFPSRAGVELRPIPEAPKPADSPAVRLRQMRTLAREFSVHRRLNDQAEWQRLLTTPTYRYDSADENLLDGAMFVFVTDSVPMLVLLIETGRTADGYAWQYALARMTSANLGVFYKDQKVWSVPKLPWNYRNLREPIIKFVVSKAHQ